MSSIARELQGVKITIEALLFTIEALLLDDSKLEATICFMFHQIRLDDCDSGDVILYIVICKFWPKP